MHEASLMTALMRRVGDVALAERAQRVTRVSVRLGALSHMSPEHFHEHFEHASRGTLAEGAALEIESCDDLDDPQAQAIGLLSVELEW